VTPDQQRTHDSLMATRESARRALDRARGLNGNGAESAYALACHAVATFLRSVGEIGYMEPKRKWRKL
jgi:hypothetical protein